MPKFTLTEDRIYKGQIYPAGDRDIPDDLAIALGLDPSEAPTQPDLPPETAAPVAETPAEPEAPDPEPAPKASRAKK